MPRPPKAAKATSKASTANPGFGMDYGDSFRILPHAAPPLRNRAVSELEPALAA